MVITRDDDLGVAPLRSVQDAICRLDIGDEVSVLNWHVGKLHAKLGILSYEDRVLVGQVLEGFLLTKQDVTHACRPHRKD